MMTKFRILIILAILISEIGFASNNPKMDIKTLGKNKNVLSFQSEAAFPVEITFRYEGDEILYQWQSKTPVEKLTKVFDLTELTEGKYNVCLNYGEYSISRELKVTGEGIIVGPEIRSNKPYFYYKDDLLKLSFLNASQKEVYFKVYQNNELINQIYMGTNLNMQKMFSLADLNEGEYDVVLSDFFAEHHFTVRK